MEAFDIIIIGSGPAGLGAAFHLIERRPKLRIAIIEKNKVSSGGLRNDCKMNFTYPVGFPEENWSEDQATYYLSLVEQILKPRIMTKQNLDIYTKRASRLGVSLLDIRQSHLGTDGGLLLIKTLTSRLRKLGVTLMLNETVTSMDYDGKIVGTDHRKISFQSLVIAPGRSGYRFLQTIMDQLKITYLDHIVDIGIRVETRSERYPIVKDYYDPKFYFPGKVRTFCTNSGSAYVVQEQYKTHDGRKYYTVNGHAYADKSREQSGLVNFALLRTVQLTEPLASGSSFAEILGLQAMLMGGGKPIMQRVGDFRLGRRSKVNDFHLDLYDFKQTLNCTPGDISLAMPAKILRGIWKSMKLLDTIVPGVLHPSTIMYYPEIKLYANKPEFMDPYFQALQDIYLIGDAAGTSRGITAAWASGIRAADGILR